MLTLTVFAHGDTVTRIHGDEVASWTGDAWAAFWTGMAACSGHRGRHVRYSGAVLLTQQQLQPLGAFRSRKICLDGAGVVTVGSECLPPRLPETFKLVRITCC